MNDLSKDLLAKIKNLYEQKKFSKLETTLENLKNFENLPINLQMIYAVSKALNPKSKIKDYKKSAFFFEKIYLQDKSNLEPLYNLIIVSLKANMFLNLNLYLEEVYQKKKDDPKIIEGLSKTNLFLGNMKKATFYYEKLTNIMPKSITNWTKYLASFNYHQNIDQKNYLNLCKKLDQLSKPMSLIKRKVEKKKEIINLGFLSPDFRQHSVGLFLREIIKNKDNQKFRLFAFSNLSPTLNDKLTNEIKENFDEWHDILDLSDDDFLKLSKKKDLDILIDLAGFTNGNRVNAIRARCAPIQISWLGYCNTLGLENMDYLITDQNLIKKDEEDLYSEKIIYMPKIWNSLGIPKNMPDVIFDTLDRNNTFTFGSLSNFQKISENTIKVWSKILNNTDSKLILKTSINNSEDLKKNLLDKFLKHNVNINKIHIFDRVENEKKHLEFYNRINLTLDPFPYPGVTTSFESILMGTPFLTMKGNNFNSRCGESINKNLDLEEFIAHNENDYYEKAIMYYKNPEKLKRHSLTLREKALNTPLFDVKNFSKNFYRILNEIYKNH